MEHPEKKQAKAPRARHFSRRIWALVLALIAAALAVAFVLLLPAIKQRYPIIAGINLKANLPYRSLGAGVAQELDTITVSHSADGEHYTLRYRDGQLTLLGEDEEQIVNESYTAAILEAATEYAVEDTVTEDAAEVSEYLADMGLAPAQITVLVRYTDGQEHTLELGYTVPGTTYHYYRWSGDAGIYMCDIGTYEAFEYTAQMLLPVEQPTLVPALINQVTLRTQQAGEMVFGFAADGTEATLGTLREPYHYPMDAEATQNLLSAIQNFRMGTKIGAVTAENRATYGFDEPALVLDVHQQEGLFSQVDDTGALTTIVTPETTIRLTLGSMDGSYFYYCEYAGVCYRVSSFLVASLVAATPEAYLSRTPADMGDAPIASITVQLGDGALDVRATYTERVLENNQIETDNQGNTIYDISVTANGLPITEDAFTALVNRLAQMTVAGNAENRVAPVDTPRWQLTITTTSGNSRTLAAYPLDAFSDVLMVDGVVVHTMNAEAMQIALAELYMTAKLTTPLA